MARHDRYREGERSVRSRSRDERRPEGHGPERRRGTERRIMVPTEAARTSAHVAPATPYPGIGRTLSERHRAPRAPAIVKMA